MKFQESTVKTVSSTHSGEGFTIQPESAGKIINMLINMYSSPVTPIRELIVNGIEATYEKVRQDNFEPFRPVELDITTDSETLLSHTAVEEKNTTKTASVTVTDHSIGMSEEEFRNVFLNIATSSKDTSDEFIGGFGIGSKSVFMLSPTVDFMTTKSGMTTRAIISLAENGTESFITSDYTGQPSGTKVSFQIDYDTMREITENIKEQFFDYVEDSRVIYTLNGDVQEVGAKYGLTHRGMTIEELAGSQSPLRESKHKVTLVTDGGVPYTYEFTDLQRLFTVEELEDISQYMYLKFPSFQYSVAWTRFKRPAFNSLHFTLGFSLKDSDITPNREGLIFSKDLEHRIATSIAKRAREYVDHVAYVLGITETPKEFRGMFCALDDNVAEKILDTYFPYNVRDGVYAKVGNIDTLMFSDSPELVMLDDLKRSDIVSSPTVAERVLRGIDTSKKLGAFAKDRDVDEYLENVAVTVFVEHHKKDAKIRLDQFLATLLERITPDFAGQIIQDNTLDVKEVAQKLFGMKIVSAKTYRDNAMRIGGEVLASYRKKGKVVKEQPATRFAVFANNSDAVEMHPYATIGKLVNDVVTWKFGELENAVVVNTYKANTSVAYTSATEVFNDTLNPETAKIDDSQVQDCLSVLNPKSIIIVSMQEQSFHTSLDRSLTSREKTHEFPEVVNLYPAGVGVAYRGVNMGKSLENFKATLFAKSWAKHLPLNYQEKLRSYSVGDPSDLRPMLYDIAARRKRIEKIRKAMVLHDDCVVDTLLASWKTTEMEKALMLHLFQIKSVSEIPVRDEDLESFDIMTLVKTEYQKKVHLVSCDILREVRRICLKDDCFDLEEEMEAKKRVKDELDGYNPTLFEEGEDNEIVRFVLQRAYDDIEREKAMYSKARSVFNMLT